ncbi:MAG: hypothetical protein KDD64_11100 [Bdellovibrionales bacterium]|nr:hypothetical protein [Bdellovibrionales bacterium]
MRTVFLFVCVFLLSGCSFFPQEQKQAPLPVPVHQLVEQPLTQEESTELLGEVGTNFVYGPGLGETMLAAGSIVLFPPSALFFLGNAAVQMSGYDGVTVSETLGEEKAKTAEEVFDGVVSAPGRVSAFVAGTDYRSKDEAKARLSSFLQRVQDSRAEGVPKPSFVPVSPEFQIPTSEADNSSL